MRALLVVNPKATATTARARDVLARALGSELKVDVAETQHRGHAIELGRQAVADEAELVVVLGGDGTVNEVVNGLLDAAPPAGAPLLAVVPGGSTNVFSRALGISRDPVEATGELLDALRAGSSRSIGLGRAGGRYFTFAAGLGLDAQAVAEVDRLRATLNRSTPRMFVRAALRQYLRHTDRRHPGLALHREGAEPVEGLFFGIVANTEPWTYFFDRPIRATPLGGFDTGLDVFAMRRLGPVAVGRASLGMFFGGQRGPRGRAVRHFHDLSSFTLVADRGLAFQVDGEYLGEREAVHFSAWPQALRVVCRPPLGPPTTPAG